MKLRVLLLSLVAAVGLTFASVALSQSHASKATTVTVTAKEFKFVLSASSVKAGAVTFKVVNKGKLQHDFKISGKKTPMISPGKSATLKVTLSKGSKPYVCTVAGHAAAGMKGVLKVK
jgi:nitrite reductase (NO-forming)